MRKRTLSAATALAVLFSSAALIVGGAGSAAADSSKVLPLRSTGDVVVDGVHKKVFISDPYIGKVVATDYEGRVLGSVTGLPGVTGLALSADSGRLYAAVPGADAVVALDTAAVTEQARYATGEGTDPRYVALAGGKVWFGYGGDHDGAIGSVDVTGAEPVVALDQDADTQYSGAPRLVSSPANPNVIAAASSSYHRFAVATYDVTTGAAARTALNTTAWSGITNDLAYTPDGSRLITANAGNVHHVFQTSDLAEVGTYPSDYSGAAVAVAPDGTVAVGSGSVYRDDVFVYRPGETKSVRTYDFPNTSSSSGGDSLVDGGLAWEPGGGRLFAVTNNYDTNPRLYVLDEPTKSAPTVTVKAPATAQRAKPLTVSGKVAATLPLPAGTPLTVTRFDVEAPQGKALGTKKLGAGGAFSFTDTPTASGNVTYKVAYAGDAQHSAASGTALVKVAHAKTALTLDRNGLTVNYATTVTYTATLGPTYKNRVVEIWADPWGPEPKRLLKRGAVNAKGKLSASMWMSRDTTVTAVFAGDARYGWAQAVSGVRTRAGVSTTLSRHYKWTKFGNTWYQTYHQTTDPLITTWHNAYPGRYTRLDFQVYVQGAWYSGGDPEYFPLGRDGKSLVTLDGDGAAGYRFRVRSAYIDGYNGDNVNSTVYGPWKYFNFTR
ncbi:WD40 repeat domain-containing protein [Streptomyces sp. NPDC006334]|uniref:WD40 repeat domain-containing protein n=1 Tax=Streptomyces sp. NPDC006334 TaxID=3156754 RepID=UPI0033B44EC5